MTIEEAIKNREACYKYLVGLGPRVNRENLEAVRMSLAALRAQQEVPPGWISVKDRLPEEFVSVLVYTPNLAPRATVHEGYVLNGVWHTIHAKPPVRVTHWMPLPEPPVEEVTQHE